MTPITGYEVFHSDEFKALCAKFNIPLDRNTVGLTIRIHEGEILRVTEEYCPKPPEEEVKAQAVVDTTTLKNEEYRTKVPRPHSKSY